MGTWTGVVAVKVIKSSQVLGIHCTPSPASTHPLFLWRLEWKLLVRSKDYFIFHSVLSTRPWLALGGCSVPICRMNE